ncbi:MAG TPA: hypothetical protein VFT43_08300 [Candidatus Polarisedimenticolia bacterium]|nr:hypothetical protein [Candidatus Polarisedimenticolia bacterium]
MRLRRALPAVVVLAILAPGCGSRQAQAPPPAPPKRFPAPIFDGLWLGMTRAEAARTHPIRPALTAAGKNRLVWVYDRPGDFTTDLTFAENTESAPLQRIDVHFGRSPASPEEYIARFETTLGAPEVRRRKAVNNAYGDQSNEQYDTIWSDARQYVFLTERVPLGGRNPRSVYYLTVKLKELRATGPPTGYVPPPPPKGKDGKPVEEPIF